MPTPKESEIKVRVTEDMKAKVVALANRREVAESVIVREALMDYLRARDSQLRKELEEAQDFLKNAANAEERRTWTARIMSLEHELGSETSNRPELNDAPQRRGKSLGKRGRKVA